MLLYFCPVKLLFCHVWMWGGFHSNTFVYLYIYLFMQIMGLFYDVNKNHVVHLNMFVKIGVFMERMCFGDCGIYVFFI